MNKTIIAFLLSLICANVFAGVTNIADANNYYHDNIDEMLVDGDKFISEMRMSYNAIIDKLKTVEPEFVEYITSLEAEDAEKLIIIRSFVAQKTYDYYENLIMSDFNVYAKTHNRSIKTESFGDDIEPRTSLWLDRGILDESQCQRDGWTACEYPDGYVEYSITAEEWHGHNMYGDIQNQSDQKSLFFIRDMPEKNATQICDFNLSYETYSYSTKNTALSEYNIQDDSMFYLGCSVYKYDEYNAWRNQEVQDVLAGKYDVIEWKDYGNGTKIAITKAGDKHWKSDDLPDSYGILRNSTTGSANQRTRIINTWTKQ